MVNMLCLSAVTIMENVEHFSIHTYICHFNIHTIPFMLSFILSDFFFFFNLACSIWSGTVLHFFLYHEENKSEPAKCQVMLVQ